MIANASVPLLLSPKHLSVLVLSAIKVDLTNNFAGALMRYQLSHPVADIILSLTAEEISLLADLSEKQNVVRVACPSNPTYWSDLKRALAHKDSTAVNLGLLQSLLPGIPSAAAA